MITWDSQYPEYGFAQHKGYGTAAHQRALEERGVLPIHRKSFAPIARLFESK
jgi:ribonuclease HII